MKGQRWTLPPLPVDRGWAWWVVVGYFINFYIAISWLRSLAILFPVFLEKYKQSAALTTLAFGIGELVEGVAHVLISLVLINRVSVRYLALFGTIANVLGIVSLSVWSKNVAWLNIAFGVIGFARAFLINPQVYLLGVYFKKRLSFASSIGNTGSSTALISTPLLTQLLLTSYGLDGTFLLFAGIATHSFISSLLFRPTSMYDSSTTQQQLDIADSQNKLCSGDDEDEIHKLLPSPLSHCSPKSLSSSYTAPERNDITTKDLINESNTHKNLMNCKNCDFVDAVNDRETQQCMTIHDSKIACKNNCALQRDYQTAGSSANIAGPFSVDVENENYRNSKRNAVNLDNNRLDTSAIIPNDNETRINTPDIDKTYDTIHNTVHDSLLDSKSDNQNKTSEMLPPTPEEHQQPSDRQPQASCKIREKSDKLHHQIPDTNTGAGAGTGRSTDTLSAWEVMKNPTAVLITLAGIVGTQTQCGTIYLPVLGLEQGLTRSQLPWILTIGGISDIIGKLVFGLVSDRGWMRPITIACLTLFNAGFVFQLASYFQGLPSMLALSVLFNFHAAIIQVMVAPISVQYVGLPSLPHVVSGVFLGNCVLTFGTHLAVGALKDLTDSFQWSIRYVGFLQISAVVLLIAVVWRDKPRIGIKHWHRLSCVCKSKE